MNAATSLMNRILLALSAAGSTMFRNNVGTGWAGSKSFALRPGELYRAKPGDRVVQDARPLRAGLCVGSGDTIGWTSKIVTPDMVGTRVAIFTSVESKHGKGRATPEQRNFAEAVITAGGLAGVARSEDEALAIINPLRMEKA